MLNGATLTEASSTGCRLSDCRKGFLPELVSFETTYLIGSVSKTTKSLSSLKVMKRFGPPQEETENLDEAKNL